MVSDSQSSSLVLPPDVGREELRACVVSVLREAPTPWHPQVYVARLEGREVVWKDAGSSRWPFRPILAAVLRREARAMLALEGLSSVPRVLAMAGGLGYVMELMAGGRLPHRAESDLGEAFFAELLAEGGVRFDEVEGFE